MDSPREPPETVPADGDQVACDGDGLAHGHPRVYLHLEADGKVDCPYCGRRFVRRDQAESAGGG